LCFAGYRSYQQEEKELMTVIEKGIIAEVAVIAFLFLIVVCLIFNPKSGRRGKINKGVIVATYVIALISLWAGLLVPAYGTSGELADKMLVFYIPDTVNIIVGRTIISGSWVKPFAEVYTKTVFGLNINLLAYTLAVYAAFTVIGIPMIIPVIFGGKKKKTSLVFAGIVEVPAALALILYAMFAAAGSAKLTDNFGVCIALGGVLLMLAVQCVASKHGLGIYKVFMFILSTIAAIALFDITVLLSALSSPLAKLATILRSSVGFVNTTIGFDYVTDYVLNLHKIGGMLEGMSALQKALTFLAMLTALLVTLNMIIDTFALGVGAKYDKKGNEKHNHASKRFELIRYLLQLISTIVTIIIVMVAKESIGVYLYLIALISLLEFVAAVIRLAKRVPEAQEDEDEEEQPAVSSRAVNQGVKAEESPEEQIYSDAETEEEAEVLADEEDTEEAPAENLEQTLTRAQIKQMKKEEKMRKKAEQQEAKNSDEEQSLYDGPTDSFIETLDDSEKIEFKQVFLDKSKGNISGLPDYKVGGDNQGFFDSFFIYLGSLHKSVSDELLQKVYQRVVNP
jgi:hypothetical protein